MEATFTPTLTNYVLHDSGSDMNGSDALIVHMPENWEEHKPRLTACKLHHMKPFWFSKHAKKREYAANVLEN